MGETPGAIPVGRPGGRRPREAEKVAAALLKERPGATETRPARPGRDRTPAGRETRHRTSMSAADEVGRRTAGAGRKGELGRSGAGAADAELAATKQSAGTAIGRQNSNGVRQKPC